MSLLLMCVIDTLNPRGTLKNSERSLTHQGFVLSLNVLTLLVGYRLLSAAMGSFLVCLLLW